jgi:ABC-type Fe3+/spermidine/putrescine transport system ATPase subunit
MEAAELRVEDLETSFSGEQVLNGIDLEIESGEFCVIVGPSGCGKSTLLKCIAGLHEFEHGRILVDGRDVTETPVEEREMAFVFQEFEETLFPHKTVAENVAFGLRQFGSSLDETEINRRVDEMLDLMAIPEVKHDEPGALSGGQQQRVELARQLVRETHIMLLDDPLADLDYKLQKRMELEMRRLHEEKAGTFVYVTHNQDQALKLADRLVVMHDGRIEQVGTPEDVYDRPTTAFVGRFIGDTNLFTGRVTEAGNGTATVDAAIGRMVASVGNDIATGTDAVVLVRPEDVRLGVAVERNPNAFDATFESRTYTGDLTEFAVSVPREDGTEPMLLHVNSPGNATIDGIEPGDGVTVGWAPGDATCFDEISTIASTTIADLQML